MPPLEPTTSDASSGPLEPGPRRRDVVVLVVGLVVVLALGLALVLVETAPRDDRPRARVGDVLVGAASGDGPTGRTEVTLPWTRVEVAVGEPVEELPAPDQYLDADGTASRVAVRSPEGGSFVRVGIDRVPDRQVAFAVAATPFTGRVEVSLRADGRDYPLTESFGGDLDADAPFEVGPSDARWVAVAGVPDELDLLLTVDGVTQVVGADGSVDAGTAAALAELPTRETLSEAPGVPCTQERRTDRSGLRMRFPARLSCEVTLALRTPYVDGLGWAEEGSTFLVVQAAVDPQVISFDRPGATSELWREGAIVTTATLAGEAPLATADVEGLNGGLVAARYGDEADQFVFEVAEEDRAGELELGFDVPVELGGAFVTDRRRVAVRWTVAGGELA